MVELVIKSMGATIALCSRGYLGHSSMTAMHLFNSGLSYDQFAGK